MTTPAAETATPWVSSSAPGKLFLLGEYAVLAGAPALLTAVDRSVTVTVAARVSGGWLISAPSLGIHTLELDDHGALPADLAPRQRRDLRVFDAVRTAVLQHGARFSAPLVVTIDSNDFLLDGNKLGLGSSAAVAAALAAALANVGGLRLDRSRLCTLAIDAHRRAQHGTGSGGDVATSVYGGLLSYTQGQQPIPLEWPEDLTMFAVVTGTGSRTVDLVARVDAFARREPAQYRADIASLASLAGQARHALSSPDAFLALASDYFDALVELDTHAQAGIITERHRELHALAARHGATFKSSGAGGGDVGLAFCRAGDRAASLTAALEAAGADVVPLGFGAAGVQDGFTP